MPSNIPDFEKAEYLAPSTAPTNRQQTMVSGDVDSRDWAARQQDHARFTRALVYGIGGAILGSILYAGFTIVTHIRIGYVAIGVGYLVGKAMLAATSGHSSRKYQWAAAILTYLSVSFAAVPEILWVLHKEGRGLSHLSARSLFFLAQYGVASPFLEIKDGGLSGLIGLLILFIGMRAAWRLTADRTPMGV